MAGGLTASLLGGTRSLLGQTQSLLDGGGRGGIGGFSTPGSTLLNQLEREAELSTQIETEQGRDLAGEVETELARIRAGQTPGLPEELQAEEEGGGLLNFLAGGLTTGIDTVKNLVETVGEAASGDFENSFKAGGRALGSFVNFITPGVPIETILEELDLDDDIIRLLQPEAGTGIGTGTPLQRIFGSSVRARDAAAEIAALLGEQKTNIDPNGDLFGEFGESALQDVLTGIFGAAEIVGDPINFVVPGFGAAAKGIKLGTRVAQAATGTAAVSAAKKVGVVDDLVRAFPGLAGDFSKVDESAVKFALEKSGGLTRGQIDDVAAKFKLSKLADEDSILKGTDEGAELVRMFGSKRTREALEGAIKIRDARKAQSFIPGGTFAEQVRLGQRTAFGGPYGAILRASLPESAVKAVDHNFFGFLTGANEAAGGGSALFKNSSKTMQILRQQKLVDEDRFFRMSREQLNDFTASVAEAANVMDERSIGRTVARTLFGPAKLVRELLITDASTPATMLAKVKADVLRGSVAFMREIAERPALESLQRQFDEAARIGADIDDFNKRVIAEVESNSKLVEGAKLDDIEQLVIDSARDVGEINAIRLDLQNANRVYIDKLVDDVNYFGRTINPLYEELVQQPKFKKLIALAKRDRLFQQKLQIGAGPAAKARTLRGIDMKKANEWFADKLNLPKGTQVFESDVLKALGTQGRQADNRMFNARLLNEFFTTSGRVFDPERVQFISKTIRAQLDEKGLIFENLSRVDKLKQVRKWVDDAGLSTDDTSIDALTAAVKEANVAVPRDLDSMVQMALQHMDVDTFKDFKSVFAWTKPKEVGKIRQSMEEFVGFFRSGLLAAPTGVLNDIIGNITTAFALGGQNPVTTLRAARAYAFEKVARGQGNAFLRVIAKDFKDFKIETLEGPSTFQAEIRKMMDQEFFSRAKGSAAEIGPRGPIQAAFGMARDRAGIVGSVAAKPFEAAKRLGNAAINTRVEFENMMRAGQAMKGRTTEGLSLFDSISKSRQFFFDYSDVTRMEREGLRKLTTFYTWAKKSIPLVFRTALEDPIRFKILALAVGAGANADPELPEWAQRIPGHRIGTDRAGNPVLLSVGSSNFSAVYSIFEENILRNMVRTLNPILKAPLEAGFDRDLFTGKPIGFFDPGKRAAEQGFAADRAPSWMKWLPKDVKTFFGFQPQVDKNDQIIKYKMNPKWRFLFENVLPLGGFSRTAEIAGGTDPRKTTAQKILTASGLTVASIPAARADQRQITLIRRAQAAISKAITNLPGKPLKVVNGRLVPNFTSVGGSKEGRRVKLAFDEAEESALRISKELGEDKITRENRILAAKSLVVRNIFPQYGSVIELFDRLREARDYAKDPEAIEKKHQERIDRLIKQRERSQLRRLFGADAKFLLPQD